MVGGEIPTHLHHQAGLRVSLESTVFSAMCYLFSFGVIADSKARVKYCFTALEWFGLAMPEKFPSWTSTGILSGVNQLSRAPPMLSQHCQTTGWHQYLLCDLFIGHLTEQLVSKLHSDDKCRLIQVKFLQQLSQVIVTVLKHVC